MLILNHKQIIELAESKEMSNIIEDAMKLYETSKFNMPDRIAVTNSNETYLYMPAFTEDIKGTKILTLYPDNVNIGEPTIYGVMLLNNKQTGKIEAIIDGASLTAFRTAAVGACGIKYTTRENITCLGIIGAGVQGFYQSIFATQYRPIKELNVFDISQKRAEIFAHQLKEALSSNIEIRIATTTDELLANSELIVTTTTSNQPVLPDNPDLFRNKHFIGIGSYKPNMQEFPKSLFDIIDTIYIDVEFAKEETGDLAIPLKKGWIVEENIHTLGDVIEGKTKVNKNATTLFKSVGMALFDIAIADYLVKKSKEIGIGEGVQDSVSAIFHNLIIPSNLPSKCMAN